jgi:Zn-dependent M28 family amino/carboxypeptidase
MPAQSGVTEEERWWNHIVFLADDKRQGREAGTAGHREAAEYVAREFHKVGALPAGTKGFFQPVELVERKVNESQTSLEIVRGQTRVPLELRKHLIVGPTARPGELIQAPMVFVGYGMQIPEAQYDDFAGLDVRGKVIVTLMGAPASVAPALSSHYSSREERAKLLKAMGATGTLVLVNPDLLEIPWSRAALMQADASMDLADPQLAADRASKVRGQVNPEHANLLLEGSGHSFDELVDLHRRRAPLPKFALAGTLRAKTVHEETTRVSDNVVAMIKGSDPRLASEYVLLSAHLDHIGRGEAVNGDAIRNGAMDNASGVATLLEMARMLQASTLRTRRSILLLACTAEEKGLLGSKYFAERSSVPVSRIVANVNLDMMLPLFPLKIVRAYGLGESDLADRVQTAARQAGIQVQDDPEPQRNIFIRSDQYSFIKKGIPALFLGCGFAPKSAEEKIFFTWLHERYHGPADDLNQPVDKKAAADFNRLMTRLALEIANADQRPAWRQESFFRRYVPVAQTQSGR